MTTLNVGGEPPFARAGEERTAPLPFLAALAQCNSFFDVGGFPSTLMPPIPRRLARINVTAPPGIPTSRSRRLLAGMSWGLAATALASPALHHVWHTAASSASAHSSFPAFVAASCFSLAVAFFTSAPISACSWDDHLTRAIAHVFAFALWALGFVMVYAVFFN
jgi:hypothetical protein